MTVFQAFSLIIGFSSLIVAILALSYTFSQKK
ncbi:putative holin-like toxin [Psychrobacillus sp. FSL H8-0510]